MRANEAAFARHPQSNTSKQLLFLHKKAKSIQKHHQHTNIVGHHSLVYGQQKKDKKDDQLRLGPAFVHLFMSHCDGVEAKGNGRTKKALAKENGQQEREDDTKKNATAGRTESEKYSERYPYPLYG